MSEYLNKSVSLAVKHVPDSSMEVGPDGNKVKVELPGHVELGAVVDGAFFPLAKMGKSRFDKHVGRAQANQPAPVEPTTGEQG